MKNQKINYLIPLVAVGLWALTIVAAWFGGFNIGSQVFKAQSPVIISAPAENPDVACADKCEALEELLADKQKSETSYDQDQTEIIYGESENIPCEFLASKNGTKFYTPNCGGLERINPENLICFATETDAQNAGYEVSKTCK